MDLQINYLYKFGPYILDSEDRILRRDGELVQLTPKAFDTLLTLVENAGRILEKEELMKKVWPDAFVEEANLAVNISSLRKILADGSEDKTYIETIPRRGYRFVARVKRVAKDAGGVQPRIPVEVRQPSGPQAAAARPSLVPVAVESPRASRPQPAAAERDSRDMGYRAASGPERGRFIRYIREHRAVALLAILAVITVAAIVVTIALFKGSFPLPLSARPSRVAVLPFVNTRQDAEADFLSFSLADAVITRLGYVSSIIVRPSSYIDKYQGPEIDVQQVAAELNVDKLVTASFFKDGDNLVINAQLFDVQTDSVLWGETIHMKYDRLLTVQDVVASKIIQGLQVNLSAEESARLRRDMPQASQAYTYYLRGVDLYHQNEFRLAIEMLEQSVAIDQNYALAWAHLGRAYTSNASFHFGGREQYEKAQHAYEKALEINPDQVEARIFMANLFTDTGRVEESVPLLRKALETSPNHAEAHWELGYAYRYAGMLAESIEQCELARQIDPNVKINSSAFNSYLYVGQYDRFLRSLPETEDIAFIIFYRGLGRYYLKDYGRATPDLDRAYELKPNELYARIGKALSFQVARKQEDGLRLLRETEKRIVEQGVNDAEGIYKVAQAYAVLGDKESALRVLRRSIELGFFCYPYFASDPMLENIRKEAEYHTLMEMARTRHEDFRKKFF
ncbi:MAG TPA: winged helix-turn-helix domain-containing protein [Blastocatellia bacterium]|nr:winged helix-turn-helix domain-containing protein [Blastocatellia bacterium]